VKSAKNPCVTFDLWETLIFDDPDSDQARGRMRYKGVQAVLADHGIKLANEDLEQAYEQSATRLQAVWNRNEEVPIMDQVRLLIQLAAGRQVAFEPGLLRLMEDAYVNPILTIRPKMNPDAPAVLRAVRDRGYKIGLISNTGRSPGDALRNLLNSYDLLKFFQVTVFSNEVGRRKPDRIIFEHAARLLGAENHEVIHVGDNPETDFWGARNAGMRAIFLNQTWPGSSSWGPNSLYALTRANMKRGPPDIEPRFQITSLTQARDLVDSLFAA
jgi:putative hydrolase of the HAD superfamily